MIRTGPRRRCPASRRPGATGGFSLVELTLVLVIVGVIAAVAGARLLQPSPFGARATADELGALLRYAQQLNMNFAADAELVVDSAGRAFRLQRGGTALRFPGTDSDSVAWPSGVSVTGDCARIGFSRRGDSRCDGSTVPAGSAPVRLQVSGGGRQHAVCVHAVTGFTEVRFGSTSCG